MRKTVSCAFRLPIPLVQRLERIWQHRCDWAEVEGSKPPTKTSLLSQALEALCEKEEARPYRGKQVVK